MNIKIEEIRIGNIFKCHTGKVFEFSLKDFAQINNEDINLNEIIKKPITLNEEWLMNFGFEIKNGWFELWVDNLCISIKYNSFGNVCNIERGGMKEAVLLNSIFNYVHQLQNLYFSLTGRELKII